MGVTILKNRKYSDSFKEKAANEAIEVGNRAAVARKYGISSSVISKWIKGLNIETPMDKMTNKAVGNRKEELLTDFKDIDKIEGQNLKLKKLIGDKELEIEILRDLLKKRMSHCLQGRNCNKMDFKRI